MSSADDAPMMHIAKRLSQPVATGILLRQGWQLYNQAVVAGVTNLILYLVGISAGFVVCVLLGRQVEEKQFVLWLGFFWTTCCAIGFTDVVCRLASLLESRLGMQSWTFLCSAFLGSSLPQVMQQPIDQPEVWIPACASVIFAQLINHVAGNANYLALTVPCVLLIVGTYGLCFELKDAMSGAHPLPAPAASTRAKNESEEFHASGDEDDDDAPPVMSVWEERAMKFRDRDERRARDRDKRETRNRGGKGTSKGKDKSKGKDRGKRGGPAEGSRSDFSDERVARPEAPKISEVQRLAALIAADEGEKKLAYSNHQAETYMPAPVTTSLRATASEFVPAPFSTVAHSNNNAQEQPRSRLKVTAREFVPTGTMSANAVSFIPQT